MLFVAVLEKTASISSIFPKICPICPPGGPLGTTLVMLLFVTLSFLSIFGPFTLGRGLADAGNQESQKPLAGSNDAETCPFRAKALGSLTQIQHGWEASLRPDQCSPAQRPIIIGTAFPVAGHSLLPVRLLEDLVERGYDVKAFIGSAQYQERLAKSAIDLVQVETSWWMTPDVVNGQFGVPDGPPRFVYHVKHFFLDATPTVMAVLRNTLESVRSRYPDRQVVLLHESGYMGALPFLYGSPPPEGYSEFPKVITVSPSVNSMSSVDLFPAGPGLQPDHSEEGRRKMKMMHDKMQPMYEDIARYGNQVYQALNVTKKLSSDRPLWDAIIGGYDATLLFHPPSLEYPRSDLEPSVRYVGALPIQPVERDFKFPTWWHIIEENASLEIGNRAKRKVVFVVQGTAALNYNDLIIPVIRALADRADLVVIASLGKRGASLPASLETPANVHVADFIPYQAVMPHTDVFVANSGYGGVVMALTYGVPMVLAGEGADKREVSARAAWAGIALDLGTGSPTDAEVLRGIDKVLTDPAYKKRAMELKEENDSLDPLESLTKLIDEFSQ